MVALLREALMRRTEVLQGVRMLKFRDVFGLCEEGSLSKLEAAELLGVRADVSPLVSVLL
jgi:hypothetical protein